MEFITNGTVINTVNTNDWYGDICVVTLAVWPAIADWFAIAEWPAKSFDVEIKKKSISSK